jgi:hypothetical protein
MLYSMYGNEFDGFVKNTQLWSSEFLKIKDAYYSAAN